MMTYEQQLQALAKPPSPNVICKKQGMSYLEGYYVRLLANRIFGPTSVHITDITHTLNQETQSGRLEVEYTCTTTVKIMFANGDHRLLMASGGGRGYGAEGHQQAKMEAETHAFKRAMSNLGPAFGLTLYDGTNPLHNGNDCCWVGFQDGADAPPPQAGATQEPQADTGLERTETGERIVDAVEEPPKAQQITPPEGGKWTDNQRKGFCSSLNRLGIQYLDFKAFCFEELKCDKPSMWDESDRGKALKDLAPGGKLRTRFMRWNADSAAQSAHDRQTVAPKPKSTRPPMQASFDDDDIPF